MAQETNIKKEYIKDLSKEKTKEKNNTPFIQVDKHGDPVSNFIANFKRQFKDAKGLGLSRLFGGKRAKPQKQAAKPESLIGATKTVFRSDLKNNDNGQSVQTNKKTAVRIGNSVKTQQARPKTKKPKLKL